MKEAETTRIQQNNENVENHSMGSREPPCVQGYRILECLGSGGMGSVWRGEHETLGREVAIKIIHHRWTDEEKMQTRFLREARLTAAIDHPNVVPVYDAGKLPNGELYIIQKFIPGGDLGSRIAKNGPFSKEELLRLAQDCGKALQALSAMGILHRDIKPGNILLEQDGTARLTDFGLAWSINDNSELTECGQVMGTPSYLSPEQARSETLDTRTDVYSLGASLYYSATGRPPFVGESSYVVVSKTLSMEPEKVESFNRSISPDVSRIIHTCLRKQKAERYRHPGELLSAIQKARHPYAQQEKEIATVSRSPWRSVILAWFYFFINIRKASMPATESKKTRRLIYPSSWSERHCRSLRVANGKRYLSTQSALENTVCHRESNRPPAHRGSGKIAALTHHGIRSIYKRDVRFVSNVKANSISLPKTRKKDGS